MISSEHLAIGIVAVILFPLVILEWIYALIDPKGFWTDWGEKPNHPNRNKRVDFFTFLVDL